MSGVLKVACIQVSAGPELGPNLDSVSALIRQASDAGARFILTPENVVMIETDHAARLRKAEDESRPYVISHFSQLARETGAWLLAGSVAVKLPDQPDGLVANRSYLFDPGGRIVAYYDKIHMFDVDLPSGERYRESAYFQPGNRAVVADTPWGVLGLSICYDLRFPTLFRALAHAGAKIIAVPSAFTVPSGKAHWHTLIRARAIETGSFVLAPAQTGTHAGNRKTYGHSLIVSPWGELLADAGEEPGVIMADLDLAKVDEVRAMIPSLRHDREWHLVQR